MTEIDTDAERERIEQWHRDEAFFSTCEAARRYLSEIDSLRAENQRLRDENEFSERYRPQLAQVAGMRETAHWGDITTVLDARIQRLRAALDHVLAIAVESEGVASWHRNGDIYQWDDIISACPELNTELNRYQPAQKPAE